MVKVSRSSGYGMTIDNEEGGINDMKFYWSWRDECKIPLYHVSDNIDFSLC